MADLNTADIREYLKTAYSDEEITTLCSDYFRNVYDDFAQGMTKGQKIQLLFDHCQRRGLMPNLLAALEKDRPEQYQRQFGSVAVERGPALAPRGRDPKQVFISHAHKDAAFVRRLADDLRSHGWRPWIAPDSILPGEKWAAAINRALEESGVFVLVLTPAALRSDWVTTETSSAIALEHQRKMRFIPLEVAQCNVPPLWDVYQRIPFKDRYEDGLAELLALMGTGQTPRVPPITRPRWLWAAVGGMLGLLAVIGYIVIQVSSQGGGLTPLLAGISSVRVPTAMTSETPAITHTPTPTGSASDLTATERAMATQTAEAEVTRWAETSASDLTATERAMATQTAEAEATRWAETSASDLTATERAMATQTAEAEATRWAETSTTIAAKVTVSFESTATAAAASSALAVSPTSIPAPTPSATKTATARPSPTVTFTAASSPSPTSAPTANPSPSPRRPPTATASLSPTNASMGGPEAGAQRTGPNDMVMVYVSAGPFTMGGSDSDPSAANNEKPQSTMNVDGFWISRTEITNAQYLRCMKAGQCSEPPGSQAYAVSEWANRPVVDATWDQANAYARWVGGRLPTEAEWEKACRGTDARIYPWGNTAPNAELCNWNGNQHADSPSDVGSFPKGASPYGLLDMAGNVWELTSTRYANYPYNASDGREEPVTVGAVSVLRGDAYNRGPGEVRCLVRDSLLAPQHARVIGFRVVAPPVP